MTVKNLAALLREYEAHGDGVVLESIKELATRTLINFRGYSCVESISTLQCYGYTAVPKQVVGEPDPKVQGIIRCGSVNIPYGAVMTPCQKQLAKLLDDLDELLFEQDVAKDQRVKIHLDNQEWSHAFKVARTKVVQLAKSIFFEPSIRKVRFGELVIFCKEAGLDLNSSDNTAEESYFIISSHSYELRVDRQWT